MQANVPIVRRFTLPISDQLPCARGCGPLKPIPEGKVTLIAIEIEEALAGKERRRSRDERYWPRVDRISPCQSRLGLLGRIGEPASEGEDGTEN